MVQINKLGRQMYTNVVTYIKVPELSMKYVREIISDSFLFLIECHRLAQYYGRNYWNWIYHSTVILY